MTEINSGEAKTRGPRTYKPRPTPRERVITESLAAKVKELTGRDVSAETCRAVKWSLSRWYEDPATKTLLSDMDSQLKKARAQAKLDKLRLLERTYPQATAGVPISLVFDPVTADFEYRYTPRTASASSTNKRRRIKVNDMQGFLIGKES